MPNKKLDFTPQFFRQIETGELAGHWYLASVGRTPAAEGMIIEEQRKIQAAGGKIAVIHCETANPAFWEKRFAAAGAIPMGEPAAGKSTVVSEFFKSLRGK